MSNTATMKRSATRTVAVIGNPNTGKSTLFNALTGLSQHVGNYPGVTVERKVGTARLDDKHTIELIDLPGTYSLAARSPDEMIAVDVLLNQLPDAPSIDAVLAIADASNPERNFYLISQLIELDLPVVVALNMLDVAESKGIQVDTQKIGKALGVPVVGICANRGRGLEDLRAALLKALDKKRPPSGEPPAFPKIFNTEVDALLVDLNAQKEKLGRPINRLEAFRALVDKGGHAEERLTQKLGGDFKTGLEERRKRASTNPLVAEEVRVRYGWVKNALAGAVTRPAQPPATGSDTIDKWVTHWFTGSLVFIALMFVVFQCIFVWAKPIMDLISKGFDMLGDFAAENSMFSFFALAVIVLGVLIRVSIKSIRVQALLFGVVILTSVAIFKSLPQQTLREGALKAMINDGIIKGVGAVLVFLPQICLLFLFIAIMEDCGYMARAAFLMDRLLSRVGLSGKSFIPMLSSFACAVPGIMATRTIENWRDRLTTILVAPLMSCSARLPVYTLMILAFIPDKGLYFSWLGMRGVTLFAMYFVGILVAVPVAWILKKTLLKGETPPFLIELPSYKIPDWRGVTLRVIERGNAFVVRAGTIILAVNLVVWALAYFPHPESIATKYGQHRDMLEKQSAARVEKATEPNALGELKAKNFPLWSALDQAAKYDAERDAATAALENEPDEKKRAEQEKAIDAKHEESLQALSKVAGIAQVWPKAAEIRDAQKTVKEGVETLKNEEASIYLRQSYFGRMGKFVEPAFKPLGWDWRISMAAIASFPAREVIVATLGTIFSQGDDVKAESASLQEALKNSEWDRSSAAEPPRKLFSIAVALSIMVFFALCSQCAATLATIRRETNSWFWPFFSFTYMTVLAYLAAMATYQIAMLF